MKIRDRIVGLRRVRASELRPNPRNWRTHSPQQTDALTGVLAEIGYADALLARALDDGSLELIDGHLRAATTPNAIVPVLVLDVSSKEADKILLSVDPMAAMAGTNRDRLCRLLGEVETQSDAVATMFTNLAKEAAHTEGLLDTHPTGQSEIRFQESFQVVIECDDEETQRDVYDRMTDKGYCCRLMTL